MSNSPAILLLLAVASIVVLVLLVTWRRMNAFLALIIAALVVGLGAGLAPKFVLTSFLDGMGTTLGGITGVICLGAMLGKLLAESGGASVLAERCNRFFGPQRAIVCVIVLAILVGLVTWFAVGLLILLPVLITLTKESRRPFLLLAIPLLSFLSVMHGLLPPHPGPVVAIEALGANAGKVLLFGFLVGLPVAMIAGPVFACWVVPRLAAAVPEGSNNVDKKNIEHGPSATPSFVATLFIVLLPIGLMLLATGSELWLPADRVCRTTLSFIGHPVVALAVGVLVASTVFQQACGFSREQILHFTEQSIAGTGMMLLVVGAGGGFARVLRDAGVATALGEIASGWQLPPLVYGWMLAAFIRVATGSATVAITAAAGVLAPFVQDNPEINRELLVLSLGCGSIFLSHLNDGGFWIVKDCLGLTVGQTLRTWTVIESLIGLLGVVLVLFLDFIFKL